MDEDYSQKFIAIFDEFETIKRDCADVFQKAADARRIFDIAFESAFKSASGTIPEKKAHAAASTVQLREAMDDAEVKEKVLKLTFSALESQLGAIQSAAKTKQLDGKMSGYTT